VLDQIVARADGMPLYLEELTKSLLEPGAAWNMEAIPASLADALMGRLDRLSAAKEVAQRAAVLGREFGYALLAATAGIDEAALRHGLGRLVDAEILFARGEPPAATYTFKHALIQETAYQSLLKRTRQQLHARVAQVLEERFPERAASEPEVIARHYEQAGLVAQAIAHYQRAGERATQRSANEEAIDHLRRALGLGVAQAEQQGEHNVDAELHRLRAEILIADCGLRTADCGFPLSQSAIRNPKSAIRSRGALQPLPGDRPAARGQGVRAARRHQPGAALAAPRQTRPPRPALLLVHRRV
jgi:predicted ATPase